MNVIPFLFGRNPLPLVLASITGLVSGGAAAGLIALIGQVISGALQPSSSLLWIFIPLALVTLVTRVLSQFMLIRLAHRTIYELRMRLCRRILGTPLPVLERLGKSHLIATLTDDVQAIFDAAQVVPYLLVSFITLLGCLVYLGCLSLVGLALVLLFMGIGAGVYLVFHRGSVRSLTVARRWYDLLLEHFHGVTDGSKELQLHVGRREDYLNTSMDKVAREFHRVAIRGMNYYTIAGAWSQLLLVAILGLFVFAFASWGITSPGNVAAFGLTLLYLARPLDVILQMMPALGRAQVALAKVESLGLALGEPVNATSLPKPLTHWTSLELVDLSYGYPTEREDERFHVGPINLSFSPGEIVFITGGNGSGKSTLAKLILGLYQAEKGEIRLSGQAIPPDRLEWYRQHFTAIFSDFHLFRRIQGLEGGDDLGAVAQYLTELHLTDKVKLRDRVFEFAGLSQGQRKRLALLMAYLEDRPIYLFDEWAADQDPHFRDVFYTHLVPELKAAGKLVLVISHDERYFPTADRVIKMEGGVVGAIMVPSAVPVDTC